MTKVQNTQYVEMISRFSENYNIPSELAEMVHDAFCSTESNFKEKYITLSSACSLGEWLEIAADLFAVYGCEVYNEINKPLSAFDRWLHDFVNEKELDLNHIFEVEGTDWGMNFIPLEVVLGFVKKTAETEQEAIKNMIVKIDFYNADVMDYFKHLAKALAI